MDINSVLHFVSSQIEKIIGVVAALFIATTALLIFRSIKEEKSEGGTGSHVADAASIEDALRRVLAQTPITTRIERVEGASAPEPSVAGGDDKDERINALQTALQKAQTLLKERLETAATASVAVGDAGSDAVNVELKKEVDELRARLSEYEIIEDDIADLAMFKEENARLKQEVETFKVSGAAAPAPAATVSGSAPAPAEPAVIESEKQPEGDPFAALMNEAKTRIVAEQDAAAAEKAAAPEPLGTGVHDPADTAKMVVEAQALADTALKNLAEDEDGVEVLSNLVDTDKLIDEVNALDAEDLMSEFKDKGKP